MLPVFLLLLSIPQAQEIVPELRITLDGQIYAGEQRLGPEEERQRYLFRDREGEADHGWITEWRSLAVYLEAFVPEKRRDAYPWFAARFRLVAPSDITCLRLAEFFLNFPRCGYEEIELVSDCLPEPVLLSPITHANYANPLQFDVAPDGVGVLRFSVSAQDLRASPLPGKERFVLQDLDPFLADAGFRQVHSFGIPGKLRLEAVAAQIACFQANGTTLSSHWYTGELSFSRGKVGPAIRAWNSWLGRVVLRDRWPVAFWEVPRDADEALACYSTGMVYRQETEPPEDWQEQPVPDRLAELIQTVSWFEAGPSATYREVTQPGSPRIRRIIGRVLNEMEDDPEILAWQLLVLGRCKASVDPRYGEAWRLLRERTMALGPVHRLQPELEFIAHLLDPSVWKFKRWKDLPEYEHIKTLARSIVEEPWSWDGDESTASPDWLKLFLASFAMRWWGGQDYQDWRKKVKLAVGPRLLAPDGSLDPDPRMAEQGSVRDLALATLTAVYAISNLR